MAPLKLLAEATLLDPNAVLKIEVVQPKLSESTDSPNKLYAKKLWERLNGIRIHIDSPILKDIESKLNAGDKLGAADIATNGQGFINVIVKQFAAQMSSREETIRAPLSDFVATIMGITRDNLDSRLMLNGNFIYIANPEKVIVPNSIANDILGSNNHYSDLDQLNFDISQLIIRQDNQQILSNNSKGDGVTTNVENHPDPSGVLTSRAWMVAHASAGTNRRLVEYSLKEFLCLPMSSIADTQASDSRIGQDVDRNPGGKNETFLTTCKGCHTVMDGFRGAFSKFDMTSDGKPFYKISDVQSKMNKNSHVYPNGFKTTDDSWINYALRPNNMGLMGWKGDGIERGRGVNSFGTALSNSERFSLCMSQRVMEIVCRRNVRNQDLTSWLKTLSIEFEQDKYNLRKLFQKVAIHTQCLGDSI